MNGLGSSMMKWKLKGGFENGVMLDNGDLGNVISAVDDLVELGRDWLVFLVANHQLVLQLQDMLLV